MRDPKELPEWIELDYYRRPRTLRRLRRRATWAILLVLSVLVGLNLWRGDPVIYQGGALSAAHTMFSQDCASCHTEAFRTARRLLPANAGLQTVSDAACRQCHPGSLHHPQQVDAPGCASCHREHQGPIRLRAVEDAHCTACHGNLQRQDGTPPRFPSITSFVSNHPDFRIWHDPEPRDPGVLRFNHQVHLREEGIAGPDGQRRVLDCTACHQPDAQGRTMQPVRYDSHCRDCHPLSIPLAGSWSGPAAAAAAAFRREPAPHRSPADVEAVLRARYTRFQRDHEPSPPVADDRGLPGRPALTPEAAASASWVEQQLEQAERVLFAGAGGCRYCHQVATPWQPGRLPDIVPPKLPERWLGRSVFQHDSHRMLRCTECHGGATTSRQTSDVLLPRIDNCRSCHNPQVGAGSGCAECHHYHDHRLDRGWQGTRTIADCLRAVRD